VVDAAGNLWLALWGAARLIVVDPQGHRIRSITLAAPQATCPAFGGDDLSILFCTSATQGMQASALAALPEAGKVFTMDSGAKGLAEPQVLL
jgi:sugar lactone lactonase YvrE